MTASSGFSRDRISRLANNLVEPVLERFIYAEAAINHAAGPFEVFPAALCGPVLRGTLHESLDIRILVRGSYHLGRARKAGGALRLQLLALVLGQPLVVGDLLHNGPDVAAKQRLQ